MNRTKEVDLAIHQSIAHWEQNLQAAEEKRIGDVDISGEGCALCRMFILRDGCEARTCKGCPIFEKTGMQLCACTPYTGARRAKMEGDMQRFAVVARDMIAFLKSLLVEQPVQPKKGDKLIIEVEYLGDISASGLYAVRDGIGRAWINESSIIEIKNKD